MTRIAVIAAMPGELGPLVRGWRREWRREVDLWRRPVAGGEWIAACAGSGADAAARALGAAEQDGPVDAAISAGWAGALREDYVPGRVYEVSGIVDTRTGERFRLGAGDCWLATHVRVAGRAEKRHLAADYGACLVDMEASAIARLAKGRGMPFRCFKGVSDGFSEHLPDFNPFLSPDGGFRLAAFAAYALFRPWHWPALLRMSRGSRIAALALGKRVLDALDNAAPTVNRNG